MIKKWQEVTLAEVCSRPQYGAIARGSDEPVGPRFVRQTDIVTGRIDWSSVPYCDLGPSDISKYAIRPGDLLVSRLGAGVGTAATVRHANEAVFAGYLVRFQALPDRADPVYLGYQLHTPAWSQHVNGFRSGAAQPTLNAQQMGAFRFRLPPLDEQRRIAMVLGAVDDLIDLEQRAARHADELWRVIVASDLQATERVPLASLALFVNGRNFTKGGGTSGLPVIRTPEVRNGPTPSTIRNVVSASNDHLAQPGDILFVWSGSLIVSRWRWQPGLVNQHIFKVIPDPQVPDWLVLWAIEELMGDFLGVAADKATTMGHIKRGDLDRIVEIPSRSRWTQLDAKIRPLWDEALQAQIQASALAAVRGYLLPLLMSGEVRVSANRVVA